MKENRGVEKGEIKKMREERKKGKQGMGRKGGRRERQDAGTRDERK